MSEPIEVEFFAGYRPDGGRVVERLSVNVLDDGTYQLTRSPCFVQGVARGDIIKFNNNDQTFELVRRSGNLCIRVIAMENITTLAQDLIPVLEKLGGHLDVENDRILVFSIHVSCGFDDIEQLLQEHIGEATQSAWFYGNVYNPADGVTPLNWWNDILKPQ